MLKTLQKGAMIQLERRGYYIVDVAAFPPGKPMLLIKIPDGTATLISLCCCCIILLTSSKNGSRALSSVSNPITNTELRSIVEVCPILSSWCKAGVEIQQ